MNAAATPIASTSSAGFVAALLRWTYGIVPIVAGLDKFTNILTHWSDYLNHAIVRMLPMSPEAFMHIVGIIEIIAGIIVLVKPKIGGIIVAIWLLLIALSLLCGWMYVDVAVRDIVMAIGAYSLAKLS